MRGGGGDRRIERNDDGMRIENGQGGRQDESSEIRRIMIKAE